jgi:hypothetical protein
MRSLFFSWYGRNDLKNLSGTSIFVPGARRGTFISCALGSFYHSDFQKSIFRKMLEGHIMKSDQTISQS